MRITSLSHRPTCRLCDVDATMFRVDKGDHIYRGQIYPFGQTASIGDEPLLCFTKCANDLLAFGGVLQAVNMTNREIWQPMLNSSGGIGTELLGTGDATMKRDHSRCCRFLNRTFNGY